MKLHNSLSTRQVWFDFVYTLELQVEMVGSKPLAAKFLSEGAVSRLDNRIIQSSSRVLQLTLDQVLFFNQFTLVEIMFRETQPTYPERSLG